MNKRHKFEVNNQTKNHYGHEMTGSLGRHEKPFTTNMTNFHEHEHNTQKNYTHQLRKNFKFFFLSIIK